MVLLRIELLRGQAVDQLLRHVDLALRGVDLLARRLVERLGVDHLVVEVHGGHGEYVA